MNDYSGTVAENWWGSFEEYRRSSTDRFFALLPSDLKNKHILDLGCGPGEELVEYRRRGAKRVVGLDISPDMVRIALTKSGADSVIQGDLSSPLFHAGMGQFDWIVSKWAMQAVACYDHVYESIHKLLQPNGMILILLVHPLRQYMEKKKNSKNYFKQEVVESVLFEGAVTVREPSHTISDVLSNYFLTHFDLLFFEEGFAKGCEVVNGDIYPSYLMIKARKR